MLGKSKIFKKVMKGASELKAMQNMSSKEVVGMANAKKRQSKLQPDTIEHKHNPTIKGLAKKMKGAGPTKSGKYQGMSAIERKQFQGADKAKKDKYAASNTATRDKMIRQSRGAGLPSKKHRPNPDDDYPTQEQM